MKVIPWVELALSILIALGIFSVVYPSLLPGCAPNGYCESPWGASLIVDIFIYVALLACPVLLIFLGQRGRLGLRVTGWAVLALIAVGVIAL